MRLNDTKITIIDGYIVQDIALHPCDAMARIMNIIIADSPNSEQKG